MFYESHRLKGSAFRRDMKRALCVIESAALGPTKLELAFPTDIAGDTRCDYSSECYGANALLRRS